MCRICSFIFEKQCKADPEPRHWEELAFICGRWSMQMTRRQAKKTKANKDIWNKAQFHIIQMTYYSLSRQMGINFIGSAPTEKACSFTCVHGWLQYYQAIWQATLSHLTTVPTKGVWMGGICGCSISFYHTQSTIDHIWNMRQTEPYK